MAEKLDIAMPQDLDLVGAWTIRVTALDSSGNLVSGVNVSDMSIIADSTDPGTVDQLATGPFLLGPGPNA